MPALTAVYPGAIKFVAGLVRLSARTFLQIILLLLYIVTALIIQNILFCQIHFKPHDAKRKSLDSLLFGFILLYASNSNFPSCRLRSSFIRFLLKLPCAYGPSSSIFDAPHVREANERATSWIREARLLE